MITTRQADKLIAAGKPVRMTDTHGVTGVVTFIARDRRHVEYRDETGHVGKMDRGYIATAEECAP